MPGGKRPHDAQAEEVAASGGGGGGRSGGAPASVAPQFATEKPAKSAKSLAESSPTGTPSAADASRVNTVQKTPPAASVAAVAAADAAASAADTSAEPDSEWRTEGSAYVGRGILRTVCDDDGQLGEGWGKVVGWLSADESDFTNEKGEPAGLWHVVFDDAALGEEDLEEHEVKAAVIAWELAKRKAPRCGKKGKGSGSSKKRKSASLGPDGTEVAAAGEPRVYFVEEADDDISLPQLAQQLHVDAEEIVKLNCERYKGLKNTPSCRLKPHTVLVLPPLAAPESASALSRPAAKAKTDASASSKALSPSTGSLALETPVVRKGTLTVSTDQSVGTGAAADGASKPAAAAPKPTSIDPKTALLLLQNERSAAIPHAGPSASHSESLAAKSKVQDGSDGVGRKSSGTDWLMAMRPNLVFPPFPGVTEDMGVISREYISHFYCPFVKKQGITYAATGFEAVAPVTAEVEDNWAECDNCQKWRRLPGSFVVADGAAFTCSEANRSCDDPEDAWDDEEELEIENEKGAVLTSALENLDVEGLEVSSLGRIELTKGYWGEKNIFPVGYRARRTYWGTSAETTVGGAPEVGEKSQRKIQYECVIEKGENGPLFSVTPVGPDGELVSALRKEADTAAKAWTSFVVREAGAHGVASTSGDGMSKPEDACPVSRSDGVKKESNESTSQTRDNSSVEELAVTESLVEEGADDEAMRSDHADDRGEVAQREGGATGHWERDQEGQRVWITHEQSPTKGAGDVEMTESCEVDGPVDGAEGDAWVAGVRKKSSIVNGNLLFGVAHDKVRMLIRQLDGAEDIVSSQERNARRRQAGTLEERIREMPAHLLMQQNKNAKVPVRNVKTRQYLIGDEAPRAKEIKKFLVENPDMVCVDPSSFNRADAVMLDDYCKGLKLCYDCKKGVFANKDPSKFECRFKMLHTGPEWKKDPRMKEDKDPLAHLKHTSKFKTDYPPGTILKLDFNADGMPTRLRMSKEFVQDALQVNLEFDDVLDEEGFAHKVVRMEKREAPRLERKIFVRPPWPPQLPENSEGCARAAPRRVQSFTAKCEFTHHAREHYGRLISQQEYKALTDSERFRWMKENQNKRLILGRSGIEGYGIFARHPIYKGEMVVEYTGERVRPVVADKREEEYEAAGLGTYFWRLEDYLGSGEPPEGRASIVDATIRHNIGHYINHCCDPNCKASIMRINGQRKIIITAEHDIQFGEELSYDYKLPLEPKDKKLPCYCGAHICKGTMN